jgi:hypothetical protein
VDKDTGIIAFKGVQLCPACVAKDKDPYLHALFTDCKFFDVEPNLNERALPPVMQHACTQTEAAPPADDGEPTHLTIGMIQDAFLRDVLGEANKLIDRLNDKMFNRVFFKAQDVVGRMIEYTDLELIAGVKASQGGQPATADAEFRADYYGRYNFRDKSGRHGDNVESVALMVMAHFPEFMLPLEPGLRPLYRYPHVCRDDEHAAIIAGFNAARKPAHNWLWGNGLG